MKKFLSLFFALVFAMCLSAQVYYLLPNSDDQNCEAVTNVYDNTRSENMLKWETWRNGEEDVVVCPERAAYEWFKEVYNGGAQKVITYKDLTDGRLASNGDLFNEVKVLWVNVDRYMTRSELDELFPTGVRTAIANYVKAGGNVYFSTFGVRVAYLIGRTPEPGFSENDGFCCWDNWKLTAHFRKGEEYDVDKRGHAIYQVLRDHNTHPEGDYTCFHMQKGVRSNRNCLWDIDDNMEAFNNFQNNNTCGILGSWGHTAEFLCAGLVEFYPVGDWKGTVIANGLAACSFSLTNEDVFAVKELTKGVLDYLNARPKSGGENPVPMEEKLAEDFFYPSNTTTFRTLHPDCEGLSAAYSLTSNPDGIARIQEGVIVGENTITQLQFKAAGTVNLHIVLTEARGDQAWDDGNYEYDREITFAYENPNAAQEAVEADLSSDGKTDDRFMLLHPNIRGLDSVSYTIVNNYGESGGQALKVKDSEDPDAATRLCFTHEGSVQLQIKMNETDWVEAWPMGEKDFTKVVTFAFERPDGPTINWPLEFFKGGIEPNSVITLPAQIEGLTPTYTVTGDATVEGNTLTVGNVTSGSFTVTASVTENDYKLTWPVGTYQFEKSLPVYASEVGYLLPAAESIDHMAGWYDGEQPEYNAAKWFQDTYIATGKGRFVTLDELPTLFAKGIKTLWVNIERIDITTEEGLFTDMPAPLKTYIQAGGNVLLTKQATRLAYLMDRIGYAPEFNAGGYSTENTNNLRSIATCMGTGEGVNEPLDKSGHRLYSGMLSYWEGKNVFLVAPNCKKTMNYCSWQDFFTDGAGAHAYENNNIQRLKDFENAWSATVFGIQGSIGDYCFSDVVEFNATGDWQGRILAIGSAAYQWGTSNNHVELENMKTLTSNALSYLLDKPVEDEVYTRDIMNNMYGTICWGYAVEEGHIEGAEMYELTSFNAAGDAIILTEVTSMMAGRAYFFFGTSDQLRLTYHGQKKEAEEGGHNGLVGYIPLMGSEPYRVPANDNKYILYYDELLLVDSEIDLPAHRAYVNYNAIPSYQASAPANVRRRVMSINRYQAPTGLETVEHSAQSGSYDILGRKVNNPQSAGFYIINGKKVIITQ